MTGENKNPPNLSEAAVDFQRNDVMRWLCQLALGVHLAFYPGN
jgi:hypothetical protein